MLSTSVESDYWVSLDALPVNPYYSWLTKPYILTRALQKASNHSPSIEVLSQSFSSLETDEQIVHCSDKAYLREVFLMIKEEPWVYARVSISSECSKFLEKLLTIGNRPIGVNLLYNDPGLKRSNFQYRFYEDFTLGKSKHHLSFSGQSIWARRSTFTSSQAQLLVSEFFSPHIQPYRD